MRSQLIEAGEESRTRSTPAASGTPRLRVLVLLGLLLLACTFLYTAWLSDDCYFTLRTIDNFLHGHGLRWNVCERVQAYTHPLWMLLLTGVIAVTGAPYLGTLVTSVVVSLAACVLLVRSAATRGAAVLALALLLSSRAFVDYATSGLENPLSYLCAALFVSLLASRPVTRRRLSGLSLVAALAALNRLDTLLLYGPALALVSWQFVRRAEPSSGARAPVRGAAALASLALGIVPLVLWELFSFVYYGALVPNTAHAKLGSGLERAELLAQGLRYVLDSLRRDPLTLPVIVAGCGVALARRARAELALAAGIALYLSYVLWIGGDFMSGRLFSPPFFLAVALIGRRPLGWSWPVLAGVLALAALASPFLHRWSLLRGERPTRPIDPTGIADERTFYYRITGLFRPDRAGPIALAPGGRFAGREVEPFSPAPPDAAHVTVARSGMQAYYKGPSAIVINDYALADPLLARLPARFDLCWRIGHFSRFLPPGYPESLRSGRNEIRDSDLARLHELVGFVTRGPLLDRERLRVALELSLGRYDHLIDRERYLYPELRRGELLAEGDARWTYAGGDEPLEPEGLRLGSGIAMRASTITIEMRTGELGRVVLLGAREPVWRADRPSAAPSSRRYVLAPGGVTASELWLVPLLPSEKARAIVSRVVIE